MSSWAANKSGMKDGVKRRHLLAQILAQAATACGLLYGRKVEGGFVTHDTRHTAVTHLMQAGHDLKTVAALTGHSDKAMVMLYSHATKQSVDSAYAALETFAGTGTFGLDLDSISKSQQIPQESNGVWCRRGA